MKNLDRRFLNLQEIKKDMYFLVEKKKRKKGKLTWFIW